MPSRQCAGCPQPAFGLSLAVGWSRAIFLLITMFGSLVLGLEESPLLEGLGENRAVEASMGGDVLALDDRLVEDRLGHRLLSRDRIHHEPRALHVGRDVPELGDDHTHSRDRGILASRLAGSLLKAGLGVFSRTIITPST